jgi:nitric oxide reductase NorQ protein
MTAPITLLPPASCGRDHDGIVEQPWHAVAERALATTRILLLIGSPGCGKTSWVQHASRRLCGAPAEELQGGPKVDDASFWGRYVLRHDETVFRDGPLARALRRGSICAVNDSGLIPYASLANLLPFRNTDRVVNPISQDELPIPAATRIVLTANPDSAACRTNFTAVQALVDGAMVLRVPDPGRDELEQILRHHVPDVSAAELDTVLGQLETFREVADGSDDDERRIRIGPRAALQLLQAPRAGFPLAQAVELAMVGKFVLDKDLLSAAELQASLGRRVPR